MKRVIKELAIVIKKRPLLKTDYLVTVFSQTRGKLTLFAKGVKKITSRRLANLETGNLVKAIIREQKEKLYLQEVNLISGFYSLKKDKEKQKDLFLVLFLIDRLLPEREKNQSLFKLLINFLSQLTKRKKIKREEINYFITKILVDLGYYHQLKQEDKVPSALIEEIINEKLPSFII